MPPASRLPLFVAASLALLLTPGPAVLYIVARSAGQGRAAGLASVAGVAAGNLLQASAAAAGLASLLLTSPAAFGAVKLLGAAYLVYLGLGTLFGRSAAAGPPDAGGAGPAFRQGLLVALLNPKTALFFLAFLPQFADPAAGPVWIQILALGVLFVLMALFTDGGYALASGWLAGRLRPTPRAALVRRLLTGATYLGLGLLAGLSANPRP